MRSPDTIFAGLARSTFRSRFRLGATERTYLRAKGLATVREHARDLIGKRLAPAQPAKDGKQTPFRGRPLFVAQHATGTCCRGCLEKWHGIPRGRALAPEEVDHVVTCLERWLAGQEADT